MENSIELPNTNKTEPKQTPIPFTPSPPRLERLSHKKNAKPQNPNTYSNATNKPPTDNPTPPATKANKKHLFENSAREPTLGAAGHNK
jgi:hypothetical protein